MRRTQAAKRLLAAASSLVLCVGLIPSMASAQAAISKPASHATTTQRLTLGLGKSAIVDLPVDARDVVVSDPNITDAVMRTGRRAVLLGTRAGETNVFFLDAQGRQILALEIRVARDTSELNALIQRLVPEARVVVDSVGDSIILTGEVPNGLTADQVLRIAGQYAGGVDKVLNMMSVLSGDQVMLRVRIVEMQRSVIKQLGMNLTSTNILNQLLPEDWGLKFATANGFSVNGAFLGGTTIDSTWAQNFIRPVSNSFLSGNSSLLDPTVGAGAGGFSSRFNPDTGRTEVTYGPGELVSGQRTDSNIQALERVGLARTLAEPNLTATSGEPAKFLAGGEFPVPTAQEGNRVSVEFKPFGVGLGFTPIILSPDRISLKISTEVSEISTAASFRQADTLIRDAAGNITDTIRGLSIPGVSVRRAENTMELPSGRSMVMAGLIQQATRQSIEGMPGLKDLPILGNLFRSRDFQSNETELVIIVTPYIVKSTTMDQLQTPGDGYAPSNDATALLLGRMNKIVKPDSKGLPQGRYRAPVGHIVN
ncbi:type II and III secretion system protein family protein [Aquidulcibacter sp.]|uniref:type II and III secretion system protein family protein n=1 Tax=Aquidulcibacter sp. TaxID=2052990 RepID=UPI0025C1AC23|nr:type II and III secretion system protein family protein [Aquidulcibacter sp.]MCA3693370.1 type II and III secretion system protein family protein [Aquidulcibacter sp.]